MSHTPGPWHMEVMNCHEYIYAKHVMLASIATYAEAEDGQLMAAAPELLEAIEGLVVAVAGHPKMATQISPELINNALTVIAKVRGAP